MLCLFVDRLPASHQHGGVAREQTAHRRQTRRARRWERKVHAGGRRVVRAREGADARQNFREIQSRRGIRADHTFHGQHYRRPGGLLPEQLRGQKNESEKVRDQFITITRLYFIYFISTMLWSGRQSKREFTGRMSENIVNTKPNTRIITIVVEYNYY